MERTKNKKIILICAAATTVLLIACMLIGYFTLKSAYPRPYRSEVQASQVSESLVYAVAKAESGFREGAESGAGAIGLMQLMPATAEFICRKERIPFAFERLTEGAYNIRLGSAYLKYLLNRFENEDTALAAYNAGEGTVREWLKREELSCDGKSLTHIPFEETENYVKKVKKFRKIYQFFYDKT